LLQWICNLLLLSVGFKSLCLLESDCTPAKQTDEHHKKYLFVNKSDSEMTYRLRLDVLYYQNILCIFTPHNYLNMIAKKKSRSQKIFLFTISLILLFSCSYAQDSLKYDTIFQLNNELIICRIISVNEFEITFSYPKESLTNTLSKKVLREIHFSSGRVQKLSELIDIKGEADWEKVQITNIQSDIIGLIKKESITAVSTGTMFDDDASIKERAEKKIKKEAAKLKCHLVFIQTYDTRLKNFGQSSVPKVSITGIPYGYK